MDFGLKAQAFFCLKAQAAISKVISGMRAAPLS
jgi:hypothetical protein